MLEYTLPPNSLFMPLQGFISTEGTASLELKTLKHAKTSFSGLHRHGSTLLLRLDNPLILPERDSWDVNNANQ
eukprot:9502505-Pyramimonas_sp.AAC.1